MNKIIYKCLSPFADFCAKHQDWILALRYWKENKKRLDLKHPKLFHEKIFWLACNTDTGEWSRLADKYTVRKYVEQKCGHQTLTKLYGVWDKAEDIDWDSLPQSFVIKANNGCASVILVRDKSKLNIADACCKLNYWLQMRFGDISGQLHYSKIEPKIIAEELLLQDGDSEKMLIDYKISCFDGTPLFCSVFSDRTMYTHEVKEMLYDMDWQPHPEWYDERNKHLHESVNVAKPVCWEEMKQMARTLSEGFKYVRVDLYVIDGRPIFGELTFTPGLNTFYSEDFQLRLGTLICIDKS